jgi:restriction system protein
LGWAKTYLKGYQAIESSQRGLWALTEKGRNSQQIDRKQIKQTLKKADNKSKAPNPVAPVNLQEADSPETNELSSSDETSVDAAIPVESDLWV